MVEEVAALKNRHQFHIKHNNRIYYGANQLWLDSSSKQEDGCASVCVYNLLKYGSIKVGCPKELRIPFNQRTNEEDELQLDMTSIYDYIQPLQFNTFLPQGLIHKKNSAQYAIPNSFGIFSQRLLSRKLNKMCEMRKNVAKPYEQKIKIQTQNKFFEYIEFIASNLNNDIPVLCLNTFAPAQFYISGNSFESEQIECDKLENVMNMKKAKFVTHWVLVTGIYFVQKTSTSQSMVMNKKHDINRYQEENKTLPLEQENGDWLIQCSTWGEIAYFYLEDLLKITPLMQKLFPPCLVTYQWL